MQHIGHTMATPEMELPQALKLFSELGFDGTEAVCMTEKEQGGRHGPAVGDARIPSFEWSGRELDEVVSLAEGLGVPFLTVTQYVKAINSSDEEERKAAVEQVSRYVDFASRLGARFVRAYGGAEGFGPDSVSAAVASLKELAGKAEEKGITLLVENHPGTLTVTGEATAALVNKVASPSLKVLYDPANTLYHSDEPWEKTLDVQKGLISYVHVKDYRLEDGKRIACPVGEGCVPWSGILPALAGTGYEGPLSYEYERKWNREQLPEARTGLAQSVAFVRRVLE